ncbi:hypothetical protein CC86DRAFT_407331 [Ophiobolus disseminans]|uniref:Uncharacterized protein n=1 Tax=Ophiobolus disseminans TaxID=1469910 RepID=A0A6A6ZW56_9PLEO|nr:hypothetical protein CC86DRAFT_407331 [Ophiobolus disseminans]
MASNTAARPSHDHTNSFKFFALPRELRNLIYHHYWAANPALQPSSPRFSTTWLHLRYEGRYTVEPQPKSWGYESGVNNTAEERTLPLGLAANKQLLHEALEQFHSRAEWFWAEDDVWREQAWTSDLLDVSSVKDVTLYVGAFSPICTTCPGSSHLHGWWGDYDAWIELTEAMARDYEAGHGVRRLCVAGSTRSTNVEEEREHALLVAKGLVYMVRTAKAEYFELSLWHGGPEKKRVYDVLGEGDDISVVLKIDEKAEAGLTLEQQ